ncbi:hypothetical protein ACVIKO_000608 [Rhizobium ruizarguesonis]
MAGLLVLTALVSSCSLTDKEPPPPVVRTVAIKPTLPPEVREQSPPLSPKPDRDMPQEDVFNNWAADRTGRNVIELRRKACVAAVDAVPAQERLISK